VTKGVRIAASGIMLVLLTSCSAAGSGSPAPEPFTAFVADGYGTVTVFNTVTGTVLETIKAGGENRAIAITPDAKTAYDVVRD